MLQEGYIERVGNTRTIPVDVRIIAATNVDLPRAIAEGRFRNDLYYRLNVLHIEMPPLRVRREDIALLAQHFLLGFANEMRSNVSGFSNDALRAMQHHDWPGNVRELMNRIQRATAICETRLIKASVGSAPPACLRRKTPSLLW